MKGGVLLGGAFAAVVGSMFVLFTAPSAYFVVATFLSTSCMVLASYALGLRWKKAPRWKPVTVGIASALVLYVVFLLGNAAIVTFHPLGIGPENASSIYSLIASQNNPPLVQVAVLLFDAAGYEAFFRGTLQARIQPRAGVWSAPAIAALDAAIHLLTLNPLWVATTFVADLTWGVTYYYAKDLTASFTSHLVWDLVIFLVLPIR